MRKRSTPNKARTERKECGIIRGWLLWPRGSTAPPRAAPGGHGLGPSLPRHTGTGVCDRQSAAEALCGHGRQAAGARSLEPLVLGAGAATQHRARSSGHTGQEGARTRTSSKAPRPRGRGQCDKTSGHGVCARTSTGESARQHRKSENKA